MKYLYLTAFALLLSLASFAIGPITGTDSVCIGQNYLALADTAIAGVWSSSDLSIATVQPYSATPSSLCAIWGVSAGTATITYTIGGSYVTHSVTVVANATAFTMPAVICVGSVISLSDPVLGGVWSTTSATAATVTSGGVLTAFAPGSASVEYITTGTFQCSSYKYFSVIATPPSVSISGYSTVCINGPVQLTGSVYGGTWSSSNTSASVDSNGLVSGTSVGIDTITYSISATCGTASATHTVTVNPPLTPITGASFLICGRGTIVLSDATSGGAWSTSATSLAYVISGPGNEGDVYATSLYPSATVYVYYTLPSGCSAMHWVDLSFILCIMEIPGSTTVPSSVCVGDTMTLTSNVSGGSWSSSNSHGTIVWYTGAFTGVSPGLDTISYSYPDACGTAVITQTVSITSSVVGPITGPSNVCLGSPISLSDASSGGTWSSTNTNAAVTGAGIVTGALAGSDTIRYTYPGACRTSVAVYPITISTSPVVTASSSLACGGLYTLTASGATAYSWSPATGLSCTTCATTTINPASSTTYTVTGTTSGCANTASITIDGNRISGHITYTGVSTDSFRVWLINYNPTDSLILALDSTVTCMDAGTPYYQFDDPASGSYMVKAKLFGTIPGTSGYVPTYGLSTTTWNTAATVSHSFSADTMHINMIYGTVPPGSGFISGNVYSGAGRGTNGDIPAVNMIVYLENAATHALTYTYTDINGAYSFSNLAYNDYIIYPEAYSYYTTPSSVITLNASTPSATGINFKQHTTFGTITPDNTTGITTLANDAAITLFPNPSTGNLIVQWKGQVIENASVVISDMLGREVYSTTITIGNTNGQSLLDLSGLNDGAYLITVKSDNIHFSGKLLIQK